MSSPRAAAKTKTRTGAKAPARAKPAKPTAKPSLASKSALAAKPAPKPAASADNAVSAEALRLAAEVERGLASGNIDMLTPAAMQALMSVACKVYAALVEAGNPIAALSRRTTVSPTEVMVTASGLLKAANLAVFELGMWQSWTGR
jgi:hypothetical protein